ncbi:MAG: hypothetical protein ACYTGS_04045 [Planctomycetota bacterium]|jgi:hypothetical protein
MSTLFQVDLKTLRHLNRRVKQLKSYRGTPDELPDDEQRLAFARSIATAFLARMIVFQFDKAHDAVQGAR